MTDQPRNDTYTCKWHPDQHPQRGEFCPKCIEVQESAPDVSTMTVDEKIAELEYWQHRLHHTPSFDIWQLFDRIGLMLGRQMMDVATECGPSILTTGQPFTAFINELQNDSPRSLDEVAEELMDLFRAQGTKILTLKQDKL